MAAPAHFICGLPALSHFREDADRTASGRNQGKAWVVRCQVEVMQFTPPQWGLLCVPSPRVLGVAAARSTAFPFCTCFLLNPWRYPLWPRLYVSLQHPITGEATHVSSSREVLTMQPRSKVPRDRSPEPGSSLQGSVFTVNRRVTKVNVTWPLRFLLMREMFGLSKATIC